MLLQAFTFHICSELASYQKMTTESGENDSELELCGKWCMHERLHWCMVFLKH